MTTDTIRELHLEIRSTADTQQTLKLGTVILAAADMDTQVKELLHGRVKICGITRRADAQAALAAGASWLGFIFHEGSPRNVGIEAVEEIVRGLPGRKAYRCHCQGGG